MSPENPPRHFDLSGLPRPKRREFLKLMGAAMALASGCSRKLPEKIVPYLQMPEQLAAGKPLFFATAISHDGYGAGVLVKSEMGRPIKIEGNPHHPASLGSTDVLTQAAILSLWDPDRSTAPHHRGVLSTWDTFRQAVAERRATYEQRRGAGLHILTGSVTSPTLAFQLRSLLQKYPEARWHQYQPVNRDNVYAGARLAFGMPAEPRYDFTRAQTVLALDADFLASIPGHVRYARDFNGSNGTSATPSVNNRLYAIESTPTLTGAKADHRASLRPSDMDAAARAIVRRLGLEIDAAADWRGLPDPWLDALAKDLLAHRGASLILAGEHQPPHVHALAHLANERLGNVGTTVHYIAPVLAEPSSQLDSLRELDAALQARRVSDLFILGANPAYAAPADIEILRNLRDVPFSVHLGLHRDETAAECLWHIPATHELEAWSDTRAYDGTVTIQQPLMNPLYAGRSAHEVLAVLGGEFEQDGHSIVQSFWRRAEPTGDDFERDWKQALHDGLVPNRQSPSLSVTTRSFDLPAPASSSEGIELIFRPDPYVHDGSYANNAWLQELPKPLTELTWDNAALMSPATAQRLRLQNEDLVEIEQGGRTLRAPIWILPGHATDSVTLHLGYGRRAGTRIATDAGFNAYALQTSANLAFAPGARLRPLGLRQPLASAQLHNRMEGRDLARSVSLHDLIERADELRGPKPEQHLLYPPFDSPLYAWAMSINLDACIGCKACTIACQAENNIPVVGKSEVIRGREMHWIRVDRYFEGPDDDPRVRFQPVPCMHCERAPCEVVCPVEASVHDSDGLNVQVYNRCVGTRFCSNNCPYKVRRFNFLQYSQDNPQLNAQRNPDVTVRMRGVMEKCTYCLQRIATAKIEAEKEGRRIRDGEVVTACQAACPTEAIVFGDLNDPQSRIRQAKGSPLDYVLLRELNTLPRTSYLPAIDNPNPDIGKA